MILYVCFGTMPPDSHPCRAAAKALEEAGYTPEIRRSYGSRMLPDALNFTKGRKEAKRRTGKADVPLLVLDDDTTVAGSKEIAAWAEANPAA